ncbi:P-loop containing nucleoside triphosphate hydrolase protein [Martensiomyces pterosporus]|nr:P-loop containing nucleoside triphosphate hydrolase protein [Martensiomyces pterosporus]
MTHASLLTALWEAGGRLLLSLPLLACLLFLVYRVFIPTMDGDSTATTSCSATEQLVSGLAQYLASKSKLPQRFIVAVSGTPGSGKSYLSERICHSVNQLASSDVAKVVPMDGFHLTKAQLRAMDDPQLAFQRRGAPWTFDARGFVSLVRRLRENASEAVYAPSFDHAVGDPIESDIAVEPRHRVVIIEGLYAHVNEDPWSQANQDGLVDELWWVSSRDTQMCYERLAQRHVDAGIASSVEEARERISTNDEINGAYSAAHRFTPTRTIYN